MTQTIKVLDHGFVTLRNISGPTRRVFNPGAVISWNDNERGCDITGLRHYDADDVDPAQAARMSFDQMDSNRTPEQDHKLAEYLMKNAHWSPFEMIDVWLEIKLPIFLMRQFVRHKSASINEVSGRYVQLPAEWYIPDVVGGKAANKKQGQEDNLDSQTQEIFKACLDDHCKTGYNMYVEVMNRGVAPEHARLLLSLNHYTHVLWRQNLRDMLMFLRARMDNHAQIEARVYGQAIFDLLSKYLPNTMKLFDAHVATHG